MASLCAHASAANLAVAAQSNLSSSVRQADGFVSFTGLKAALPSSSPAARCQRSFASSRGAVTVASGVAAPPSLSSVQPVGDRVLVKQEQAEERTSGGIFLPSSAQAKPTGGTVVAVGDGQTVGDKTVPVAVETGVHVVYSKYAGTEVQFDGAPHVLLKEEDVVGRLDGDDVAQLKPYADRVLIKVLEAGETSAGGVLLTEGAKEKPVVGSVVAVGPGGLNLDGSRRPLVVSVGSMVLYSKYAATEFKSKDGSGYVVLREGDVMAILS